MILVDTSVWIDHLRSGEPTISSLLDRDQVLSHPWVVGEVALGGLRPSHQAIGLMDQLPHSTVATHEEILTTIEVHELSGAGIGYVDAQLLAATMLTSNTTLWTKDRRLAAVASRLGCGFDPRGFKGSDVDV